MGEWREVGGNHQVPLMTASVSAVIKGLLIQIDKMDKDNLMFLSMASDNMMKLCKMAAEKLDSESE